MLPSSLERLHIAQVIKHHGSGKLQLSVGLASQVAVHVPMPAIECSSLTSVSELTVGIKDACAKAGIEFLVYFDDGEELQLRSRFVNPHSIQGISVFITRRLKFRFSLCRDGEEKPVRKRDRVFIHKVFVGCVLSPYSFAHRH